MRSLALIFLFSSVAYGVNCPIYKHQDSSIQDEFRHLCSEIEKVNNGTISSATIMNLTVDSITVSSQLNGYQSFTDRGDPSDFDKTGSWVTTGTWTDLDLSSVVPSGANAVMLALTISATSASAGDYIAVRKNGNTNTANIGVVYTVIANKTHSGYVVCALDSNRIIEYAISLNGGSLNSASLIVTGWLF